MTPGRALIAAASTLVVLLPVSASAQIHMRPAAPKVEFPTGVDTVEMPLVLDGHLVTVPVVLGGQELAFVLDTGASSMALVDSKWIEILGLNVIGQAQLAGAGGGTAITVDLVGPVSLDIGGLKVERDMLAAGFGDALGHFTWDGIFGAGVLSQTVAEIDYESSVVRFHDPESFEMPPDAIVLPTMLMNSGIAAVEATITIDGQESTHWLAVDIGAFHSLSLDAEGLSRPLPTRRLPDATTIGWGVQGEVRGAVGVIDKLRLGPIELHDVITTFPDRDGMHGVSRIGGDIPVIGNLGSAILRNYTVIVDHPNQRLGLLPRQTAARPFYFNTTGISARPMPTEGRLPIHEVIANSPAAEAGLIAGDVILEVNGKPVEAHGGALRGLLMDPGLGERLELIIERDGERMEVTLQARRLVG